MKTYEKSQHGIQIGSVVKEMRERKNMTQTELQEAAGLSSGYISRLEKGEYTSPSVVHLLKVANALGMNLRDFLEQAKLIPRKSTFDSCLRGEGANEEQINEIIRYKNYVLHSNKPNRKS